MRYIFNNIALRQIIALILCVFLIASRGTDPGQTQLCHYDKVHQQAREPQSDDEPPSR